MSQSERPDPVLFSSGLLPAGRLCFRCGLFVCLPVCLSRIEQNIPTWFPWNLVEGCNMDHGRTHSILEQFWVTEQIHEFSNPSTNSSLCASTISYFQYYAILISGRKVQWWQNRERVGTDVTFPLEHTPLNQSEWQNIVQLAVFSRKNCRSRSKTNSCLLSLCVIWAEP